MAVKQDESQVAQRIDYPDMDQAPTPNDDAPATPKSLHPIYSVKARVSVCVGEMEVTIGELLSAKLGQVFALDRAVNQPVDLLLEGNVIARGDLVAVGDQFGVRITELPVNLNAL